jgi:hypothetical protein
MATAVLPSSTHTFFGPDDGRRPSHQSSTRSGGPFSGFPHVHEMHVVDASGDDVHVQTTPAHGPAAHAGLGGKLAIPGFVHSRGSSAVSEAGPPPPSPPASVDRLELPGSDEHTPELVASPGQMKTPTSRDSIHPWEFHP